MRQTVRVRSEWLWRFAFAMWIAGMAFGAYLDHVACN